MKAPLSHVPALPIAAGLASGIVVAAYSSWMVGAAACVIVFIAFYAKRHHYASFYFLFAAIGCLLWESHAPAVPSSALFDTDAQWRGAVLECRAGNVGQTCVVRVESRDSAQVQTFKALLRVSSVVPELEPGLEVSWRGHLYAVNQRDALPSERSYISYLERQGIMAEGGASYSPVVILAQPRGYQAMVNAARRGVRDAIADAPISGKAASFLIAMLLGDTTYLPLDAKAAYRQAGISHILALSGMHVGIIASLVAFMMLPLGLVRGGVQARSWITILAVWAFAVLTGMSASAVRAAVMLSAYMLSRLLQRGARPANSLLLALGAILAVWPRDLFAPGLQLSFAAVASLLAFSQVVPDSLRRKPIRYFLANLAVLPVIAMLGTGLLSAYYFHALPLHFLSANILAGLLLPWIVTAGVGVVALSAIGIPLAGLGRVIDGMIWLLDRWAMVMAGWQAPQIGEIYFSAWAFLPYAIGFAALAWAWHSREHRRRAISRGCSAAAAFVLTAVIVTISHPLAQAVEVRRGTAAREIIAADNKEAVRAGDYLWAYGRWLRIIDKPAPPPSPIKIDYAVLGRGYYGSAAEAYAASGADTLVLGADLHPRMAAKLRQQCADTIPCIDLRQQHLIVNSE